MAGPVDWTRVSSAELESLANALRIKDATDSYTDDYGGSSQTSGAEHVQAQNETYVLILIDAHSHPVSLCAHSLEIILTTRISSPRPMSPWLVSRRPLQMYCHSFYPVLR